MAYAQEEILYRPAEPARGPRSWMRGLLTRDGTAPMGRAQSDGPELTLQSAGAPDAWHLFDLWTHTTPPAIARIEAYRRAGLGAGRARGRRAAQQPEPAAPLQRGERLAAPHERQRVAGFAQHGACREGPHYLRFLVRDGADGAAFLRAVLAAIGREAAAAGILAPVRTYESSGGQAAAGRRLRAASAR